jgi:hypothetical protein
MSAKNTAANTEASPADHCWVSVYLDGAGEPVARYRPPGRLQLDTRDMADGAHKLRVEAVDEDGTVGVREIPFRVRNGPAIEVHGLSDDELVGGEISVMIHAFNGSDKEDWEPSRAETPSPIPTWIWVLGILIFACAMFYSLSYWIPTGDYADAPTWKQTSAATD